LKLNVPLDIEADVPIQHFILDNDPETPNHWMVGGGKRADMGVHVVPTGAAEPVDTQLAPVHAGKYAGLLQDCATPRSDEKISIAIDNFKIVPISNLFTDDNRKTKYEL